MKKRLNKIYNAAEHKKILKEAGLNKAAIIVPIIGTIAALIAIPFLWLFKRYKENY